MVNASLYLMLLRLFKSGDYKSFTAQSTVLLLITFHYYNLRKAIRVIPIILQQVQNILYISFFLVNMYLQFRTTAKLKGHNNETDLHDSLSKF